MNSSISITSCALALLLVSSCSPLKSSPQEAKVQLELTLHELKTGLDDQRHDLNCCQTELQILSGRIKYYEHALSTLKQQDLEKQQEKLDQLTHQYQALEKKVGGVESRHAVASTDMKQLTSHANDTSTALKQFKDRLFEMEQELQDQHRKLEEITKIRADVDSLAHHLKHSDGTTYKVRLGDSLEKIARIHKTTTDRIKKANELDRDLIIVGQELRIPD